MLEDLIAIIKQIKLARKNYISLFLIAVLFYCIVISLGYLNYTQNSIYLFLEYNNYFLKGFIAIIVVTYIIYRIFDPILEENKFAELYYNRNKNGKIDPTSPKTAFIVFSLFIYAVLIFINKIVSGILDNFIDFNYNSEMSNAFMTAFCIIIPTLNIINYYKKLKEHDLTLVQFLKKRKELKKQKQEEQNG